MLFQLTIISRFNLILCKPKIGTRASKRKMNDNNNNIINFQKYTHF